MVELTFSIGEKYGCMEILDEGSEFQEVMALAIDNIRQEKEEFITAIQEGKLEHRDWYGSQGITPAFIYTPKNFEVSYDHSVAVQDFDKAIKAGELRRSVTHYKCKCRKCGKIQYYTSETLLSKPPYCYRPIYKTTKVRYSTAAKDATLRKTEKYEGNESIRFVDDKSKVVPSDEYCSKWNDQQKKKICGQKEKEAAAIAKVRRAYAKNYDVNYVGLKYESLEILECINEALESEPQVKYNQRHQKKYRDITVYKQYRCRCYLCGKEQNITCDQFGIYPPTAYGYRADKGYWSEVYCDCHEHSSFQWIVNKLLLEYGVNYQVEYTFTDLYGRYGKNKLSFDFAIFDSDNSLQFLIECQGEQHYKPVEQYGGQYSYSNQVCNDQMKRQYAAEHNIILIEISYKDKTYEKIKTILQEKQIIPASCSE